MTINIKLLSISYIQYMCIQTISTIYVHAHIQTIVYIHKILYICIQYIHKILYTCIADDNTYITYLHAYILCIQCAHTSVCSIPTYRKYKNLRRLQEEKRKWFRVLTHTPEHTTHFVLAILYYGNKSTSFLF